MSDQAFSVHMTFCPTQGDEEVALLLNLCELVVQDNVKWINRKKGNVPDSALAAGIRYVEPSRSEYETGRITIDCALTLLKKGCGPCGSIACYDAAVFRYLGYDASVLILEDTGRGYHAVVQVGDAVVDGTADMPRGRTCR